MYRKIWTAGALVVLVATLGLTAHTASSTPNASYPGAAPWFFETIDSDGDVGQHVSMAISPITGVIYISYYHAIDATHGELKAATYVGFGGNCGPDNTWKCMIADNSSENVGKYSSIAVNPLTHYPVIAYHDVKNRSLKLATYTGTSWTYKTIEKKELGTVGWYPSLAIDSTGKPHIAYYNPNFSGPDSLNYLSFIGGTTGTCFDSSYQCDLIDFGDRVGKYPSLALDSFDKSHIAYVDGGLEIIKYVYLIGSSWRFNTFSTITTNQPVSLFVDTGAYNSRHLAYYDSSGKLGYAKWFLEGGTCGWDEIINDLSWMCFEVDDVSPVEYPSGIGLGVDNDNYPIIAYQSGNNVLKVTRPVEAVGLEFGNCGYAAFYDYWQCEKLKVGSGIQLGEFLSLITNTAGVPYIAYYDNSTTTDGDLLLAYQKLQVFLPMSLGD